jgi:hypothetical protein
MRYLVAIARAFPVEAPTEEDAILRAFEAEALGGDELPQPRIEVMEAPLTEAERV